jgi:hypothetical protein
MHRIDIMKSYIPDLVESTVSLTVLEKTHIEEFVLSHQFPWYYQGQQTFYENKNFIPADVRPHIEYVNSPFFSHTLLIRSENPIDHHSRKIKEFSAHYEFFFEIFHRWTVENNINYTKIFRANLNQTWFNGHLHTEPHLDHEWSHKNFIMYLTDFDEGQTILFSDDFQTLFYLTPKKYTAISFNYRYHAHRFPKVGQRRVVFVVTYI